MPSASLPVSSSSSYGASSAVPTSLPSTAKSTWSTAWFGAWISSGTVPPTTAPEPTVERIVIGVERGRRRQGRVLERIGRPHRVGERRLGQRRLRRERRGRRAEDAGLGDGPDLGAAQLRVEAPAVQAKTAASAATSVLRSRTAMTSPSTVVVRSGGGSHPPNGRGRSSDVPGRCEGVRRPGCHQPDRRHPAGGRPRASTS